MVKATLSARILTLTFALAFACVAKCLASSPVDLTPGHSHIDVLPSATVADGSIPYATVSSGHASFVPFAALHPHGWPVSLWIRFSVSGASVEDAPTWYLVLPRWTESAELYRPGVPVARTSMYLPFSRRPADLDFPSFPILERDDSHGPLLLHLTYYPDTDLSLSLMTQEDFRRQNEPTLLIEAAFLGVLLAVGILNLFVVATTRDRDALYYLVWILTLAFGEIATSGIGDRYVWANLGISNRLMTYFAQVLAATAFFTFTRVFLRTKAEAPRLDLALRAWVWLYVCLAAAQVLVPGGSAIVPAVLAIQVLGLALAAYVGVARYRSGYVPAIYFVWGFVPVGIGITASLTWQFLQPPMDGLWFFAYNGGELGIMLQTIVLSFGVADRIRFLERAMRWTQRELSEVLEVARSMESRALADPLTGVANRAGLEQVLDRCIKRHGKAMEQFAVLFCDLDGFKDVNDRFGHQTGDDVLRIVARRLVASLRNSDCVARLGGDEFAIVIERASPEQAATVVRTLEGALEAPIVVGGATMPIGISVGTALFPSDGRTTSELLAFADRRMYERKQRRRTGRT